MKAAIYARVSTEDQTTDNQLQHLEGWAASRGFQVVAVYKENETAWKEGHQAQLNALVQAAYKRKFELVLVWSLDRVTREGPLSILSFVHKLRAWGVKLYSYQEPWTEAPGELGDLLYSLTGWVARYESSRRSERTKAGIERKRAEGFRWGRPLGSRDRKVRKRRKIAFGQSATFL